MRISVRKLALLSVLVVTPVLAFAKDAAIVVAKNSKTTAVQSAAFIKAFKSAPARLANGQEVVLVVKALNVPEAQVVGSKLLGQTPEGLSDLAAKQAIIVANSDAEVIRIVSSTPNAVGVVDIYSITSAIVVLKVDGKLPLEPGYLLHYN
ncbi:MAG: hypothetical protein WCF68_20695 [Terriglobales bacterium]